MPRFAAFFMVWILKECDVQGKTGFKLEPQVISIFYSHIKRMRLM